MPGPARQGSLYLLLGALLVGTMWSGAYFPAPKWVLTALLLAAGAWELAAARSRRELRLPRSPLLLLLLVLGLLSAAGMIISVSPADTLRESLLVFGYAAAAFTILSRLARDRDGTLAGVMTWAVYTAGIVSAWGVVTYLYRIAPYAGPVDGIYRAGSTFEYSNAFSCFSLMTLPVTVALLRRVKGGERVLVAATASLQVAAVCLSLSRFGILALAVLLLFLLAAGWRDGAFITTLLALAPGVAVAAAGLVAGGRAASVVSQRFVEGFSFSRIFPHRLDTFAGAADAFRTRPLAGSGLGTFAEVYQQFANASYTKFAHNLVLQMAVDTGVIGAALMALFLIYVLALCLWRLAKSREGVALSTPRALALSLLPFIAYNMFDWEWYVPALTAWFVVLAACMESMAERADPTEAGPLPGRQNKRC